MKSPLTRRANEPEPNTRSSRILSGANEVSMRPATFLAQMGIAVFMTGTILPAEAQRVCQPGDTECSNSRMHSQREQTLKRLDANDVSRRVGNVRGQRNSSWEQYRHEQVHRRSAPVCNSKPIISGGETRAVPTC